MSAGIDLQPDIFTANPDEQKKAKKELS